MTRISTLASWLFFPLFMPMYAVVFTMFYPSMEYGRDGVPLDRLSPELQGLLLLILFIFIVLGPVFSVLSLSKSALITGIELEDKKDRPIPIALVFVYSTLLYFLLKYQDPNGMLPSYIYGTALCGMIINPIFALISLRMKVSLHAGGAGFFTGYSYAFSLHQMAPSLWFLTLAILISGLVIGARWYLQKHSLRELLLGYAIALVISGLVIYLYP